MSKNRLRIYISLVWLLFFLFAGAAGAYYSFVRISPVPGQVTFVYTKMSGYQDRVLEPDRYYWLWEQLIPGNVSLRVFDNAPRNWFFQQSYQLPSAESYQLLLPADASLSDTGLFTYQLHFSVVYRARPAQVLKLVQSGLLDPEFPQPWYNSIEERLQRKTREFLSGQIPSYQTETIESAELEQQLRTRLENQLPEIEISSLFLTRYEQPDLALYQTLKSEFSALLRQLSEDSFARLLENQDRRLQAASTLEQIRELGRILEKYPILISYFAVQREGLNEPLLREFLTNPNLLPAPPAE